jgi:hypothetical protein
MGKPAFRGVEIPLAFGLACLREVQDIEFALCGSRLSTTLSVSLAKAYRICHACASARFSSNQSMKTLKLRFHNPPCTGTWPVEDWLQSQQPGRLRTTPTQFFKECSMSSLFGLNEFNHLVHVREVERGLACQCRCVVCEEPLVARQGSVREHHFAHASNREPCDSSHESLLHRYAKQVIVQARGLVAPMTPAVAHFLGISDTSSPDLLHALSSVQEEVMIGTIKPDLLVVTPGGIQVAVEIAYSSFCDLIKVAAFESLNLPALEIDLSRFTPDNFDPAEVKEAVIQSVTQKNWVWPTESPPSLFAATDLTRLFYRLPGSICRRKSSIFQADGSQSNNSKAAISLSKSLPMTPISSPW